LPWMSLVLEVTGRTTWDSDDRNDDLVSDSARERPVDGGVFDSIDCEPRVSELSCGVDGREARCIGGSCISGNGWDSDSA
jgi:hypothetical protein